ncbi:hypothetical protein [Enterobacteria phage UAB_Phi20]|nr:hypothetical protein BI085_gp16 [Enterobacteria phage UAB_Phi20]ADW81924.1 hypothetical protein [Enterobacteria phage UAB_Phi20]
MLLITDKPRYRKMYPGFVLSNINQFITLNKSSRS